MITIPTVPAGPRARHFPSWLNALLVAALLSLLAACDGTSATGPKISEQPGDRTAFVTQTATFAVSVEGAYPLSFQWRRNGVDIAGATSFAYTTPALTADDDGDKFAVVVSNSKGTITSSEATLTVKGGPAITTQPTGQAVNVGATATFTVQATGDALTYQWRRNDLDVTSGTGANTASYTTPATTVADDGAVYTVVVRNPGGAVISNPVTLVVSGQPAFSISPVSQVVAAGRPAIFSSIAGGGNLAYQWQRGSAAISGATSPGYTIAGSELADDGATFSVTASNGIGTATSSTATLSVVDRPVDLPPALVAEVAASRPDTASESFVVVRKSDGTVWQWGYNGEGQRGDGTSQNVNETAGRTTLPAGAVATRIAVGARHVLALLADGSVYGWGLNNIGQLGQGDSLPEFTPVRITLPAPAVAIAAGRAHSLAVLNDGRVFAWGDNSNGQIGDGSLTSFITTPQPVPGITNAVDVAGGALHSLVLLADGRVLAWGANASGQLGDGSFLRKRTPVDTGAAAVTRIRAGGNISLAITQERILLAWGENSDGQLARGAATTHDVPTPTGIASDVVDAAAADLFLLVATSDGRVLAAGANASGQLGDGSTTARNVLTPATGVSGALTVSAGGRSFSVALLGDGRFFSWGDNTSEALGNSSLPAAGTSTPTAVPSFDAIP
jgi:alpha-tubulin suppressor-like RCC1 family protein